MKLHITLRYFALFWIAILSIATLEYIGFRSDVGFLRLKQEAVKSGWYLPAFYSHIFGSAVILLCGFFQFANRRTAHRFLGKVYVFGTLFFAVPGAYVMTFFINRGLWVFLSFLIQNSLWMLFTFLSFYNIRKGNVKVHSDMAVRSYSLAFAAVTLRFYVWLFNIFGDGAHFNNNYVLIAILSWVPNLLIAEYIVKKGTYSLKTP